MKSKFLMFMIFGLSHILNNDIKIHFVQNLPVSSVSCSECIVNIHISQLRQGLTEGFNSFLGCFNLKKKNAI